MSDHSQSTALPRCIVQEPFECVHTTDAICRKNHMDTNGPKFVKTIQHIESLSKHLYNVRNPLFFICKAHAHKHKVPTQHTVSFTNAMRCLIESTECCIQTVKCCNEAVFVTKYNSSFIIATVEDNPKKRNSGINKHQYQHTLDTALYSQQDLDSINVRVSVQHLKIQKYIIFDPTLWREQSKNHFISMLRAIINMPDKVKERHQRFESSNFIISNIKRYKSGKCSVICDSIIGFDTKGIYQTSTISCMLHYSTVLLPKSLYTLLESDYDLQYVALKRDPSLKLSCLFICKAECNPDKSIDTIVIPDAIAKMLGQDQDGDKNGVYLLPLRVHGSMLVIR
ncbi:uncharacterized protein LOC120350107 [Nilaparvata lugens]|uniref:uncharacterized protein LOC120350107 n=1 Tax=Nilaparvata lugens TaxID=108931 RepID=UPI00193E77C4|nr:uncharacterized protein LOC120350107 [Nilaparvata lugens]